MAHPYASGVGYDDGSGAAEVDGFVAIPQSPPYAYTLDTDSYIYDTIDDVYIYILSTAADATIGPPDIYSIAPTYAFVGTS